MPVLAAEPLAAPLRPRWQPPPEPGIPPHVTLLYPFVPADRIDLTHLTRLGDLFGRQPPFDVRYERLARFPGVLYLAPEPAEPFVSLTERIVGLYPDYPPYAGQHAEIVPHLSLVQSPDETVLAAAEEEAGAAPVAARADEAWLMAPGREGLWSRLARFGFES